MMSEESRMVRPNSHAASAVITTASSVVHGVAMVAISLGVSVGEGIEFGVIHIWTFGTRIPIAGERDSCVPRA